MGLFLCVISYQFQFGSEDISNWRVALLDSLVCLNYLTLMIFEYLFELSNPHFSCLLHELHFGGVLLNPTLHSLCHGGPNFCSLESTQRKIRMYENESQYASLKAKNQEIYIDIPQMYITGKHEYKPNIQKGQTFKWAWQAQWIFGRWMIGPA